MSFLAEDNLINQKLAKLMLTKAGYHVETADTGKKAVDKFISSSGNAVWMTILQNRLTGKSFLKSSKNGFRLINKSSEAFPALKGGACGEHAGQISIQGDKNLSEKVDFFKAISGGITSKYSSFTHGFLWSGCAV